MEVPYINTFWNLFGFGPVQSPKNLNDLGVAPGWWKISEQKWENTTIYQQTKYMVVHKVHTPIVSPDQLIKVLTLLLLVAL